MRRFCSMVCCFTPMLALATPSRAQSLTAAQILQQFNAVIFGNFTTTADVEGRTVIGGNMTGGNTFALNPVAEAASSFSALTVYGSETSGASFNIDNAAGAVIAGAKAGSFALNGGGSVYVGGNNSGSFNSNSGSAGVVIGGSNSGQITLGSGGSIYVGRGNTASLSINGGSSGSNSISVNGNNSGYLTLNNGGTVKIAGNAGKGTLNGGRLTYTGSKGSWNLNSGATASKVSSLSLPSPATPLPDFASTFQTPLTGLSSQLAALTPNSTVLVNGNNVTLEAHPGANGIAVLDLSTSMFQPNDTVSVALNGASSLIINLSVAGCTSDCSYTLPNSVNFQNPTSYADNVLWNITDVSNLSFTNEFGGTILAPTATVMNNTSIDGTLIALNYDGSGELHDYPFEGALPTPEPSALAILSPGLLGLGVLRLRKRSAPGQLFERPQL